MGDGVLAGRRDWMRRDASTQRMERIEAFIGGHGYDMHRHDTYAIGRTLAGVQSFSYRRGVCNSLPGGTIVLHPDEPHDGQAGTEAGFQYRMIYVEPAHVQRALGGQPLPFIPGGRSDDPRLFAATETLLRAMDSPIDPLEEGRRPLRRGPRTGCRRRRTRAGAPAGAGLPRRRAGPDLPARQRGAHRHPGRTRKLPPAVTAGACRAISVRCSAPAVPLPRPCAGSTWPAG